MTDKDTMQRVDMKAEFKNMSSVDQHYIKRAEAMRQRAGVAQRGLNKKLYLTAGGLVLMCGAIYTYTIKSIKQETFLDKYDDMHDKK